MVALHGNDLVQAHAAFMSAQGLSVRHRVPFRNVLGYRLAAVSIAGIGTAIAQVVDAAAQIRLVKLRAAMSLYRQEHGSWPPDLTELLGPYLAAIPLDPWRTPGRELRYSAEERRLYTVGPNGHDDGGRFIDEFSRGIGSDDYGIRLPE
jgi:hypothetical protein